MDGNITPRIALARYVFIMLIIAAIGKLILAAIWVDTALVDAYLELVFILIILIIFTVTWYTYEKTSSFHNVIGFAYLTIAVYEITHITFLHRYNILGELLVIYLSHILVINLCVKRNRKYVFKYIYTSLIITLCAIICYFLEGSTNSYLNITGDLFRIMQYYFLFWGIFVSTIVHPYEELAESTRHTSNILNNLPLAVVTFGQDERLSFANRRAEELTGHIFQENKGLSNRELIKMIYSNNIYTGPIIEELDIKGTKDMLVLLPSREKDGKPLKVNMDTYKLEDGSYLYLFDEAKKVQALENMQLQTQTILNAVNNPILMFDTNFKIIMCNDSFSQSVEMSSYEVVGMEVQELGVLLSLESKEVLDKLFNKDTRLIKGLAEVTISTTSGKKRDYLLQVAHISNVEQEIIGAICVAMDITGIKEEQTKNQQQEKLALLGQMASGIVHEVRNPLTAILGFSQLISMKSQDKGIMELAQYIEGEVKGLNKIVSDFLSFARPRLPLFGLVELNNIIDDMKLIIDTHSFQQSIKIQYELTSDDTIIRADVNQIKQVILNIVKNALDAMNGVEDPCLRVFTRYNWERNISSIGIHNNGSVMSEEEITKVGTPFYTTKARGTGLGLSICHQIMKEHGGCITVSSQRGVGTIFILEFPGQLSCEKVRGVV